jgi:predicted GNAT superfamily acetyltransferase
MSPRPGGLVVRELLDVRDQAAASDLLMGVWQSADGSVPPELLRAMSFAGNYVAGAYRDGRLVGAAVGFLARGAAEERVHLHSHVVGVTAEARGQGVGMALKLHQRSWALDHGVAEITWTFDPLLRVNAVFNIERLGARPTSYLPDFYGTLEDPINAGDLTDRLLVSWDLASPGVAAALSRQPRDPALHGGATDGASPLLSVDGDDRPRLHQLSGQSAVVIAIPRDIAALRRDDPALARRWRTTMRQAMVGALAAGYVFEGRLVGSGYLLRPPRLRHAVGGS